MPAQLKKPYTSSYRNQTPTEVKEMQGSKSAFFTKTQKKSKSFEDGTGGRKPKSDFHKQMRQNGQGKKWAD